MSFSKNNKRIAINGMGRIGRASLKLILENNSLELVAINDVASLENIAYLLKYDSIYGVYEKTIEVDGTNLIVDGKKIIFTSERNPENLPWSTLNIDVVIESTGIFTDYDDAKKHLTAGAKTVVLSGPTKSANIPMVVHGVNSEDGKTAIYSCASCTTNNISPVIEILGRRIGVEKAIMTTIHADTSSNTIVDMASKGNFRMGRSGMNNIIPTTTGAAKATTKVIPKYENKFDGMSIRVPVAVGSISDITMLMSKEVTVEELANTFLEESNTERYKNVLKATYDPLVSTDIIGSSYASIVDLSLLKVVDGNMIKVLAWYDNEWGFVNQMIRQILL